MQSGQELIALDDVAALFQVMVAEDAPTGGVTVSYRGRTIVLSAEQSIASVNGRIVTLLCSSHGFGRSPPCLLCFGLMFFACRLRFAQLFTLCHLGRVVSGAFQNVDSERRNLPIRVVQDLVFICGSFGSNHLRFLRALQFRHECEFLVGFRLLRLQLIERLLRSRNRVVRSFDVLNGLPESIQ